MNDDAFLRNMSKTQKVGFNYGFNANNYNSVNPNTNSEADLLRAGNLGKDQTADLNLSHREHSQLNNSYRQNNDESFAQSEWDNADL